MASTFSFDVVSSVDLQLVRNALDTAKKELATRYDFKGSKSSLELKEEKSTASITAIGDDAFKLSQLLELLKGKLVRQDVDLRFIDWDKTPEPASQGTLRQILALKQGLDQPKAKEVAQAIRESGLKAKTQIQGDAVRVTSASKDDLQAVMALLRAGDYGVALSFTNYR